jgi:plastocyanin
MSRRSRERSRATAVIAAAIALVAVSAAVISQAASRNRGRPVAAVGESAAAGTPRTVDVELGDLYVKPASLTVAAGTDLTLAVANHGAIQHDLALGGGDPRTPLLDPGATARLRVGKVAGTLRYGALIVDPPDLAPVDHEYVLVQSELYFGPGGKPGELNRMLGEQWDAVVFNGYWNQYKFAPIRVEPNQRVRVWVLDAGPSENSAFHVVGTIFDTVWKEGTYLLRPDARRGGSQVLDLQPAQGGFVEFTFDEAGLYPIVTHKFASASKGALGLFQAGDVATGTAGGH